MTLTSPESVVRRLWWLTLLRGAFSVVLGLVAIFAPGLTVQAFFVVFGIFSISDGLVGLITGLVLRGTRWGWTVFQGVAGLAIGLVAVLWPNVAAAVVVIVLAFWALAIGLFQIALAWQLRDRGQRAWLWLLVSGGVTALLGLYFLVNPAVAAAFLTVTVGVFVLAAGLALVFAGLQLRSHRDEIRQLLA